MAAGDADDDLIVATTIEAHVSGTLVALRAAGDADGAAADAFRFPAG